MNSRTSPSRSGPVSARQIGATFGDEAGLADLAARHVHVHREDRVGARDMPRPRPARTRPRNGTQRPSWRIRAGPSGDRDEGRRARRRRAQVAPAQERLDPDELEGREVHDRLVQDEELRRARGALRGHPAEGQSGQGFAACMLGSEDLDRSPSASGHVHRDVGIAQQLVGACFREVRTAMTPDAGMDEQPCRRA